MYLALYRKYRPQNFDDVIGQNHITRTLINQIKTDKISHAYLFCGSRGTGKTSTAKIFARAINCLSPVNGSPCGKCEVCKSLEKNNIDVLEIDAASNNGVDEIRDLREKIKYPPVNGKYKVYIVDEVHMLSPSAFNALLKTLEEPPSYAVFILATTEVHKLPATILSRCLRFDFKLVSLSELIDLLKKIFEKEKITAEPEALELIARAGEGSVRDTLSIADRCVSYAGDNLTYKSVVEVLGTTEREEISNIAEKLLNDNLGESLKELDKVLGEGKSPLVLSKDLISYLRDLLVIYTLKGDAKKMVVASADMFSVMERQASEENYNKIVEAINVLSGVEQELRYSISPRIVLETAFVKALTNVDLLERVTALEKRLNGGEVSVLPSQASPQSAKAQEKESGQVEKSKRVEPTAKKVESVNTDSELLGKLLTFLRERKDMTLLTCVRQVKSVQIEGKTAVLYFEDEATLQLISRDKYRSVLGEFFEGVGLNYLFKIEEKRPKGDENALRDAFGGKLEIRG